MGHLCEPVSSSATAIKEITDETNHVLKKSGQWTSMFASLSTDIGSDLPLWAVQDDLKAGVSTVDKFFGGWTKAYAKQYHLGSFAVLRKYCQTGLLTNYLPTATSNDLPLCSASVDLDSFSA